MRLKQYVVRVLIEIEIGPKRVWEWWTDRVISVDRAGAVATVERHAHPPGVSLGSKWSYYSREGLGVGFVVGSTTKCLGEWTH